MAAVGIHHPSPVVMSAVYLVHPTPQTTHIWSFLLKLKSAEGVLH